MIEDLLISEAKSNDSKFIWELRNEYSIREMMRDTTLIDWETHQEWFLNMLLNDNSHLYIGFLKTNL